MRWATLAIVLLGACSDVRDFRGSWQGPRVGDAPVLRVGAGDAAVLTIDSIDAHSIAARLHIDNLVDEVQLAPVPGAEADALASMSFAGSPLRVFLTFVPLTDGGGDALAVIALYEDDRVEVRLLRSGTSPLYAIFALRAG